MLVEVVADSSDPAIDLAAVVAAVGPSVAAAVEAAFVAAASAEDSAFSFAAAAAAVVVAFAPVGHAAVVWQGETVVAVVVVPSSAAEYQPPSEVLQTVQFAAVADPSVVVVG